MKNKHLIFFIGFWFIIGLFAAFSGRYEPVQAEPLKASTQPPIANPTEIVISLVGDCTIGYDVSFGIDGSLPGILLEQGNDYSYLFKNVAPFFRTDNITVANLETTFTTATTRVPKAFNFKGAPEYAQALVSGSIEAVNLANNHIYDYAEVGFRDTVSSLERCGVNYFGENYIFVTTLKDIRMAFLGYIGFYADDRLLGTIKSDIEKLKQEKCFVVTQFHWGDEGSYYPEETQQYLAHFAIDCGADLVVGHHPHVIQGLETYKGRLIAYSLGNFCFGGNFNPYDKDTFILQTKLRFTENRLVGYDARVLPCRISSRSDWNDYCPTPLNGSEKTDLLVKLNHLSPHVEFTISDQYKDISENIGK